MSIDLSRFLAKLLRHEARNRNIYISDEGYAEVDDILDLPEARRFTEDDVREVVRRDNKKRFVLSEIGGVLQIKATQGHSLRLVNPELTRISHYTDVRAALHATRRRNLPSIQEKGLSRMGRTHIHFAEAESGVRSGFPGYTDTVVEIDIQRAMRDGIKFYRSENDVILSPGNAEGFIPSKYTKSIYDRRTREKLQ